MRTTTTLTTAYLALFTLAAVAGDEAIAAKVDGEAIYARELAEGLPACMFEARLKMLKKMQLDRLVAKLKMRHFLKRNEITIPDAVVDAEIEAQRKTPPAAGCACCQYATLDEYLEGNFYTLAEYRELIRNNKGLEAYTNKQWLQALQVAKNNLTLLKPSRAEVERDWVNASHIFFSQFEQATADAPAPAAAVQAKAEAGWQRLKKGEAFDSLAKELSSDLASSEKGGSIGCINRERSYFGPKATAALFALKIGEYSAPVASSWGFHIFRREALTDADVLAVQKEAFLEAKDEQIAKEIKDQSKVQYFPPYER